MPARRPRFSPNETTIAPASRAMAAVASVEPSSITSTSATGSTVASSASTSRMFCSSFHAGMKTTVSLRELICGGYSERIGVVLASRRQPPSWKGDNAVPGIDAKSDAIYDLVEEGSGVEQLATGFTFTEGPVWHPVEQVLYFSDMPADIRRKVTLDGTVTEVRNPSFKCNGMTLDADLNLLVCEHVTSSLVRERRDGVRETLAFHWQGKYLNSPNDVCVRSDGTIYFSDPWYGRFPGFGVERARDLGWQGVFRIPPGGGQDELELAVAQDEFDMPNGLCFSPDESLLYINDTPRAHIKVWDVDAGGSLSNGRMFFDGVGSGVIDEGIPDGMKCDERGNIWVTGPKGVWVISPEGEHLGTVEVPENVGNLTWGGDDWHTLYLPSSTSLYSIRTLVGPRREPYMR